MSWPIFRGRFSRWALVLGLPGAAGLLWFWFWKPDMPQRWQSTRADAIVVLGGGLDERVTETLRLWEQGVAPVVILTGGSGWIERRLLAGGLPREVLKLEKTATNTVENARCVKPFLERLDAREVVVVTSWYHAARALEVFRRELPELKINVAYRDPGRSPRWNSKRGLREKSAILFNRLFRGIPVYRQSTG